MSAVKKVHLSTEVSKNKQTKKKIKNLKTVTLCLSVEIMELLRPHGNKLEIVQNTLLQNIT